MSFLTTATRVWLTKSFKPFTFTRDHTQSLDFGDLDSLGLYIHIPFCTSICAFCPYCKELYEEEACNRYIDSLLAEIHMVGSQNPNKKEVTSLYFGGGTPALALHRLPEILAAVGEHFVVTQGIGLELHPENVTTENLLLLQKAGVTKISIGIQSFGDKFLSLLGRGRADPQKLRHALESVPFETVSMDFIFALPDQTLADLQRDVDLAFQSGANHVALYPFIDFTFTDSTVEPLKKADKRRLLDGITLYCREQGYRRDSIWTFSKGEEARYSSMTRENFLGFGPSATTLLKGQFKINTFSLPEYEKAVGENRLPTSLTLQFTRRQRMVYYLFWTAYSTRVSARDFEGFFGEPLKKNYGLELWLAVKLGFVTEKDGVYEMTLKGAFYYHHYEGYYTLAYIDKMWSTMRREAFPAELQL
ncbi:MAG: radical SAM protein [Oscillospiraceae bacterium]